MQDKVDFRVELGEHDRYLVENGLVGDFDGQGGAEDVDGRVSRTGAGAGRLGRDDGGERGGDGAGWVDGVLFLEGLTNQACQLWDLSISYVHAVFVRIRVFGTCLPRIQ